MKILLTSFRLGTFLATLAGIPLYLSVRVAVSLAPHDDSEPFYSFQLPYGIDTEYLFPNTTINTLHHRDYEEDRIQVIQRALTEAKVGSMFFLHKEKAKLPNPFYREGDWKIVREDMGFELVSPIYKSRQSLEIVRRTVQAMKSISVKTHPKYTNIHTSVDASNATIHQIRNVFKNFICVEQALDDLRDPLQQASAYRKSMSIAQLFPGAPQAFSALDAYGESHDCLLETVLPYKKPQIPIVNLFWEKNLTEQGHYNFVPKRFEFRGQTSSVDPEFVISWIQLLLHLVESSYDGIVLDPRSVESKSAAWNALFDQLIRDDSLRVYFEKHREYLKGAEYLAMRELALEESNAD